MKALFYEDWQGDTYFSGVINDPVLCEHMIQYLEEQLNIERCFVVEVEMNSHKNIRVYPRPLLDFEK